MIPRADEDIAREHSEADARCGRRWSCACGACRTVRSTDEDANERAQENADARYYGGDAPVTHAEVTRAEATWTGGEE